MPPLPIGIRIVLGIIAATAGILAGLLGQAIWPNIVHRITRKGRKPNPRPLRLWIAFDLSVIIAVVFGTLASVAPQPESPPPTQVALVTSTLTPTATLTVTPVPTFTPTPIRTLDILTTPPPTTRIPAITPTGSPLLISIAQSFPAPGSLAEGITWDGAHLWLSDNSGTIFQVDSAGKTLGAFDAPEVTPQGLVWDGTGFWLYTTNYFRYSGSSFKDWRVFTPLIL